MFDIFGNEKSYALLRYSAEKTADPSKHIFLKKRANGILSRFEAQRVQNGTYMEESNGVPFLIEGTVIYDSQHDSHGDTFLDTVTKVETSRGEIRVYREETKSWWTNYHDESESDTTIVRVNPETWDKAGWFSDPGWADQFGSPKTKRPLPVPETEIIPYDALYYEGYDREDITICYLRRCKEGYRLLRIHQKEAETPVEIGFDENSIQALYRQIPDNKTVTMFQDFLLTDAECSKINVYAQCDMYPEKLPALNAYYHSSPDRFVSFLRKTGASKAEPYSISSLMIEGLLSFRSM